MDDTWTWVMRHSAEIHEGVWRLVGLALGVIAAITIVVREVFHGIAVLKRSKDEYLPTIKRAHFDSSPIGPATTPSTLRRMPRKKLTMFWPGSRTPAAHNSWSKPRRRPRPTRRIPFVHTFRWK